MGGVVRVQRVPLTHELLEEVEPAERTHRNAGGYRRCADVSRFWAERVALYLFPVRRGEGGGEGRTAQDVRLPFDLRKAHPRHPEGVFTTERSLTPERLATRRFLRSLPLPLGMTSG